ncbi:hypothetical protein PILCRDRAFT_76745, partial [Piloderma croceum F 1598]
LNTSISLSTESARTAGEEVETSWVNMNLASASIQEMAPGHHHESLDNHWGGWNFKKMVLFSMFLNPYL